MKKELQEKIYKEFPNMFADRKLPLTKSLMCFGLEVGDGWFDLIYSTCAKIKPLVGDDFRFIQVKEKFGELRMYSVSYEKKAEDIIDEATEKSIKICETCGATGKLRKTKSNWFLTACDKCYKEYKKDH